MFGKIGMVLGGCALIVSATNTIISIYEKKKLIKKMTEHDGKFEKVLKTTEKAVNEMADMTEVEIKEDLVKTAIKKAVDMQVQYAIGKCVSEVRNDIRFEIDSAVRSEIATQRDRLIDSVDKKLVEEVQKISQNDIIRDVEKKVSSQMIEIITDNLNEMQQKCNKKLEENVERLTKESRNRLDILTNNFYKDYIIWRS